jgi:hypothetical protein
MVEAYRLYQSPDFLIVSLGTGSAPAQIDANAASGWGDIAWALPSISIFQDGNSQTVAFEVQQLFAGDLSYTRLDISLAIATPQGEIVDPAMDNASQGNLRALQDKANQLIAIQNKQIQSLATELAKPKAAIQPKASSPAKSLMYQLRAAIGS